MLEIGRERVDLEARERGSALVPAPPLGGRHLERRNAALRLGGRNGRIGAEGLRHLPAILPPQDDRRRADPFDHARKESVTQRWPSIHGLITGSPEAIVGGLEGSSSRDTDVLQRSLERPRGRLRAPQGEVKGSAPSAQIVARAQVAHFGRRQRPDFLAAQHQEELRRLLELLSRILGVLERRAGDDGPMIGEQHRMVLAGQGRRPPWPDFRRRAENRAQAATARRA